MGLANLKTRILDADQIGDGGLISLKRFSRLDDLTLTIMNITGAGLGHLAPLVLAAIFRAGG